MASYRTWQTLTWHFAVVIVSLVATAARAESGSTVEVIPKVGHSASVTAVAISNDGRFALSGGYDRRMKLWDVASGALLRNFDAPSAVLSVAISPDHTRVLAGEDDKTATLWDAASGALICTLSGHTGSVNSVAFSPDGMRVLTGSGDNTVRLWDAETGRLLQVVGAHAKPIYSVVFSPDGAHLASGSGDSLKIWDANSGALTQNIALPSGIKSVAFSADGLRLISGSSSDDTLRVWDAGTGQLLNSYKGGAGAVSPDGSVVLTSRAKYAEGSEPSDYSIKLLNAASGELTRTLAGHSNPVSSVAFQSNGTRVLTGSGDYTVKLWDTRSGKLLRNFGGTAAVPSVAISSDGRLILSGSHDKTVKLWDAASGQLLRVLKGPGLTSKVAISTDGTRVVSGSGVSESEYKIATTGAQVWDTATGELLRTIAAGEAVLAVAISPDGHRIATGSLNKDTKLWAVATGNLLQTFKQDSGWDNSVMFSADGTRVLAGATLWDAASGKPLGTFRVKEDTSEVHAAVLSPDSSRALIATDNSLRLWDVSNKRLLLTLVKEEGSYAAAFSPDGKLALSGGASTLKLWDVSTGKLVREVKGHLDNVFSVAFSPDGRRLISGSWDTTVRIWDSITGEQLVSLNATPDGQWIAMAASGFFAASGKGADQMLAVVHGLDVTTIRQVHQSLFNPDLVRETLAGDSDGEARRAAKVINLDKVVESGPPPEVEITSHSPETRSIADLTTFDARVTDQGKGVGRVEWRVNGITSAVQALPSTHSGPDFRVTQELALDPGENVVELIAYNRSNLLASQPARITVSVTRDHPAEKPRLHVLGIGVNAYHSRLFGPLRFAAHDVQAFGDAMKVAAEGVYESVEFISVINEEATLENLDRVFQTLGRTVQPRDTFIFFASAHGYSENGRFYLIPQDFPDSLEALQTRAISQESLQEWISSRIKARKALILLDTCESGALVAGYTKSRINGPATEAAIGRLHEATGRPVLTAAASGRAAFEGYKGHGVFTWALLDALRNGDANHDDMIELSELATHVQRLVPTIGAELDSQARGFTVVATEGHGQSARFGSLGEDFTLVGRLK